MRVIHPPVLPHANGWRPWMSRCAAPPSEIEAPRRLGGVLVVLLVVALIFSPMLLGGWR